MDYPKQAHPFVAGPKELGWYGCRVCGLFRYHHVTRIDRAMHHIGKTLTRVTSRVWAFAGKRPQDTE